MFYDELGVFELLFHIADKGILESFIRAYLGPIIDHDSLKGSELLRTLKVYLDHDGSKQIAAQQLFIVDNPFIIDWTKLKNCWALIICFLRKDWRCK